MKDTADHIAFVDAVSGQTFSGKVVPDQVVWEYLGPMRATLRVDGTFAGTHAAAAALRPARICRCSPPMRPF